MSEYERGSLPQDRFTMLPNAWIRDTRLSWTSRAIMAWLASHSAGFVTTTQAIIDASPGGRDAVRTALRELETAGYLRRSVTRNARNEITGTRFTLLEPGPGNPSLAPTRENSTDPQVNPAPGNPSLAPTREKAVKPQVNPAPGNRPTKEDQLEDQEENQEPQATTSLASGSTGGQLAILEDSPAESKPPGNGDLTAKWIDHCRDSGVVLPPATIKRYAAKIAELRKGHIPDLTIKRALAAMLADNETSRPALLDNYVVRVQSGPPAGPPRPRDRATPTEITAAIIEMGQHMEDQANQHQIGATR